MEIEKPKSRSESMTTPPTSAIDLSDLGMREQQNQRDFNIRLSGNSNSSTSTFCVYTGS